MPEAQALSLHLGAHPQQASGFRIVSGFVKALEDVRRVTGRDAATGSVLPATDGIVSGSWIGAIGYMCLIDQIGSSFKPRAITALNEPRSFCKALKYFSSLSENEILALYALRNAFAHDYSLYNVNQKEPLLTHRFKVSAGLDPKIVTLPTMQWDGTEAGKRSNNETAINLRAFGNAVESICAEICRSASTGDLEIILPGGSDELISRYAFMITPSNL